MLFLFLVNVKMTDVGVHRARPTASGIARKLGASSPAALRKNGTGNDTRTSRPSLLLSAHRPNFPFRLQHTEWARLMGDGIVNTDAGQSRAIKYQCPVDRELWVLPLFWLFVC